jgi:hypothetical protein
MLVLIFMLSPLKKIESVINVPVAELHSRPLAYDTDQLRVGSMPPPIPALTLVLTFMVLFLSFKMVLLPQAVNGQSPEASLLGAVIINPHAGAGFDVSFDFHGFHLLSVIGLLSPDYLKSSIFRIFLKSPACKL